MALKSFRQISHLILCVMDSGLLFVAPAAPYNLVIILVKL